MMPATNVTGSMSQKMPGEDHLDAALTVLGSADAVVTQRKTGRRKCGIAGVEAEASRIRDLLAVIGVIS